MSALARGYAEGLEGPVEIQRWCPSCREFVLAHPDTNACLWCEGQTVPAATAATTERRPLMAIAVRTTCKIDGCETEPAVQSGIYAGLCETHRDQAKATRKPTGEGNGYMQRVRALLPLARELDKTKKRVESTGNSEAPPGGARRSEPCGHDLADAREPRTARESREDAAPSERPFRTRDQGARGGRAQVQAGARHARERLPGPSVRRLIRAIERALGRSSCRGCGCTNLAACPDRCWWVEPDLCSSCAREGLG